MTLAQTFEDIARQVAAAQNLERSREHARPLIAVLERIKTVAETGDEGFFSYIPAPTDKGWLTIRAAVFDNATARPLAVPGKPGQSREIDFTVRPDGVVSSLRLDIDNGEFGRNPYADEHREPRGSVIDAMPRLAAWVEKNLPGMA